MKVYISGPITGYDLVERKETFASATKAVIAELQPDAVVNPFEVKPCNDMSCDPGQLADQPPGIHTWQCWMRHDIKAMMDCNTIVLLPNWVQSEGAVMEYTIAERLGFKVLYMDEEGSLLNE